MNNGLLTQDEIKSLILMRLYKAGPEGVPKEELNELVEWAERIRLDVSILDNVLNCDMAVVGRSGDGDWQFSLTEKGIQRVESLAAQS